MKNGWHILVILVLSAMFALGANKKPAKEFNVGLSLLYSQVEEGDTTYHHYQRALINHIGENLADRQKSEKRNRAFGKWSVSVILAWDWKSPHFSHKWYSIIVEVYRAGDEEKENPIHLQYCSSIDETSSAPEEAATISRLAYKFFQDELKKEKKQRK